MLQTGKLLLEHAYFFRFVQPCAEHVNLGFGVLITLNKSVIMNKQ